jgi:hypothetical protein
MSKRFLISENERKQIRGLYNLNEGFIDDTIDMLQSSNISQDIKSFIQDKFGTTDVDEIKNLSDEEKDKLEKENGIDSVDDEYYDIELDSEKSSNGNIPDGQLVNLLDPDGNQTKNKLNPLAAKDYNDMVKTAYDETDGKIEIKVSQSTKLLLNIKIYSRQFSIRSLCRYWIIFIETWLIIMINYWEYSNFLKNHFTKR